MHKTKLIVALGLGALTALALACGTAPAADQPVTSLPSASALPAGSTTVTLPAGSTTVTLPAASVAASVASPLPTSSAGNDQLDVAQVGVLTTDKVAPACPANIKAQCSKSGDSCVKPGFICECFENIVPNCGGAAAIPTLAGPPVWHCQPQDRKAKREDGCPFYNPGNGAACTSEGKKCQYGGPCSYQAVTATCSKGVWSLPPDSDRPMSLPPSAAGR